MKSAYNFALVTLGSIIYAAAFALFLRPYNISPGGVSGLSMIISYFNGAPTGTLIILLNIPVFLIAIFRLGFRGTARSIYVLIISSVFIDMMAVFTPPVKNMLFSSLYGGILFGGGSALIILGNATAGGTDILNKALKGIVPVKQREKILLIINISMAVLFAASHGDFMNIIYSVIATYTSFFVTPHDI